MLTVQKFREHIEHVLTFERKWRLGQCAFNEMLNYRPDFAEQVRGDSGLDPFYRDQNLPAFFQAAVERGVLSE